MASSQATRSSGRIAIFAITLVVATCSILYELIIAQTLSLLAANTVIWYSVTVGLYLLGMGFGSFLSNRIGEKGSPWTALIRVEIVLCLVGSLAAPLIHLGHTASNFVLVTGPSILYLLPFFGGAFLLIAVIGTLTGIELPLLMRIGRDATNDPGIAYRILGIDYMGSLVGAVLFPVVLLPNLEIVPIGFLVASLNIAVALYLIWTQRTRSFATFARTAVAAVVVAGLVAGLACSGWINSYFLRKYYYFTELSLSGKWSDLFTTKQIYPEIFRATSPYQKIDLMKDPAIDPSGPLIDAFSTKFTRHPEYPRQRILFLNGDFQFSSNYEEIYHEYFAHVPIIASGQVPKNVLVLGGGDGLLIRELVKYPDIDSITHVDLDRQLVELARTHPVLSAMNRRSLHDPRVTTRFGDAYQFARRSDEIYDAVYIDFPMPADYDLAKLYSREFFHFAGQRVKESGFVVFDATGIGFLTMPDRTGYQVPEPGNDWAVYYTTLEAAGFETITPYITTLELDNPEVDRILSQPDTNLMVPEDIMQLFGFVNNENEEIVATDLVLRIAKHTVVSEHIVPLQQGFIMMSRSENALNGSFKERPEVEMHVLNSKRYSLAFAVEFPREEAIDPDKLNSIMRPAFPTIPFWQPRSAF